MLPKLLLKVSHWQSIVYDVLISSVQICFRALVWEVCLLLGTICISVCWDSGIGVKSIWYLSGSKTSFFNVIICFCWIEHKNLRLGFYSIFFCDGIINIYMDHLFSWGLSFGLCITNKFVIWCATCHSANCNFMPYISFFIIKFSYKWVCTI